MPCSDFGELVPDEKEHGEGELTGGSTAGIALDNGKIWSRNVKADNKK